MQTATRGQFLTTQLSHIEITKKANKTADFLAFWYNNFVKNTNQGARKEICYDNYP